MRALLDVESKIASAEEKGLAQGLAKGLEKGLAQGLEKGLAKGLEQGLEQGRAEGMAKGMAESLLLLLEERFGPLPEQLRQWMSKLFTAAAPGELFGD